MQCIIQNAGKTSGILDIQRSFKENAIQSYFFNVYFYNKKKIIDHDSVDSQDSHNSNHQ